MKNMEMPCLCKCGEWHDLNDGFASKHSRNLVCPACHYLEETQEEFIEELYCYLMDDNFHTLIWNQPFASAMLHGKIETRTYATNVRGKVLICAAQKVYNSENTFAIAGTEQMKRILSLFPQPWNRMPTGQVIAVADLVGCREMTPADEDKCSVQYREPWEHVSKKTGKKTIKGCIAGYLRTCKKLKDLHSKANKDGVLSPRIYWIRLF